MCVLKSRAIRGAGVTLLMCGVAFGAQAQEVSRLGGGNPKSPIAQAVKVPSGYTTYYISGTPAGVADSKAPPGSPQRMGDTHTQTVSSLARIKDTLASLGLT